MARRPGDGWTLEPPSRFPTLGLSELLEYRELLVILGLRDVRLRYRQTAIGVGWVVLQPVLGAAIFSFVFTHVAHIPSEGIPYLLFAYVGLLLWNLFNAVVSRGNVSIVGSPHLVSKVYFPRPLLPMSQTIPALVDLAVGVVVLPFIVAAARAPFSVFSWRLVVLPVPIALTVLLGTGVALASSSLTVRFRDVGQLVTLMLQLGMYLSPVAYSSRSVPHAFRTLYHLNPLVGVLELFRWAVLARPIYSISLLSVDALVCVLVAIVGLLIFRKNEPSFADII